ncbi:MAG: tubulin-tyrosine ligase [Tatlockia sp.]|nr:tubulin-tyrosine ligase [Tatlockia sp.]
MNRQLRFFLKASQSPTHYNLSRYLLEQDWGLSPSTEQADFSDENLQFNLETSEQLEYKHLLAQLVAKNCPALMPTTYCINDQNWPQVLNLLAKDFYLVNNHLLNQIDNLAWILKPSLMNNGKAIKIFQKLADLEKHYLSSKRLGGEHVLQRYLTNPHLLRDDRKYSIRMFVITTNYAGSFIYPYGYYNVALHPYAANDFKDLRSHLTNEHLQGHEANVLQIPAQHFKAFSSLYPQIKKIVTAIIKGLELSHPHAFKTNKTRTLAIYGFDFLVDSTGRLWLLEANHGPCFPITDEHPLQSHLYYDFWQHFIENFVSPIADNQPKNTIKNNSFELLKTGNNLAEKV